MKYKVIFQIVIFIIFPLILCAQTNETSLIKYSGSVLSSDSLMPVPFVNIKILGTNRSVVSDSKGLFSFIASKEISLIFFCLGYKTAYFNVPDTISNDHYSIVVRMQPDTLVLKTISILPWQTYEQFKTAFVTTEIDKKAMDNADKNIKQIQNTLFRAYLPTDPSTNFKGSVSNWWRKARTKGEMTVPISIGFGIPIP